MSLCSLSSLSSESDLTDFEIVLPRLAPPALAKSLSGRTASRTASAQGAVVVPRDDRRTPSRRDDRRYIDRDGRPRHLDRDDRPRHVDRDARHPDRDDRYSSRDRNGRQRSHPRSRGPSDMPSVTSETSVSNTRSTLSSTFSPTHYSSRLRRRRRTSHDARTYTYTYTDESSEDSDLTEAGYEPGYARRGAGPKQFAVHGRTDVLPALQLEPHSAFLSAYRLTHLAGVPRPSSPASAPAHSPPTDALPRHLLPALSPAERRARRLALLLDADDADVRDWAMEEYVKLTPAGRRLVREGVFAVRTRDAAALPLRIDDDITNDDSATDADVGDLEGLRERLEDARERAEEDEALEREQDWARETFGRWLADGRADGVFRASASVLDALLREMAREEGEEWAIARGDGDGGDGGDGEEELRPDESASVRDYSVRGSTPAVPPPEATLAPSTTLPVPPSTATARLIDDSVPLPTPPPKIEDTPKTPPPAAALLPLDERTPKRVPDTPLKAALKPTETLQELAGTPPKKSADASPKEPEDASFKKPAETPSKKPADVSFKKPADVSSRVPVDTTPKKASEPAAKKPSPPPAPATSSESGPSTIAPPPKPNFVTSTADTARAASTPAGHDSYVDFFAQDARRIRDDRPIRPMPGYVAAQFAGPRRTPEQVFDSYADFYARRSVAGSVVSRRSARRDKEREREGTGKKDKDKDRTKDRPAAERGQQAP
ncbi:hypothetical protein K488DRAFT_70059 [Vararia minispora EC-137]|uniref:Uncharacterized protein n=1 Tax=Vararia minispora EC-137 TaxID=1314806 RepID=A0ACB8QP81_9AGAM|nr:hypothetical protein K488DRAFT_70059 [Vararia minispora EC-137]